MNTSFNAESSTASIFVLRVDGTLNPRHKFCNPLQSTHFMLTLSLRPSFATLPYSLLLVKPLLCVTDEHYSIT